MLCTAQEIENPTSSIAQLLVNIGVYGFDEVHPVILASLVTGDPLLLIGKCGTGKTYLLNSLSEAMGLLHRHYNASLISFDDLVGFPFPTPDYTGIKYLETPATIWGAESVLVDEISRAKPEHQNRLFSLVHERRIQGIRLEKLEYRWAAMNPCSLDQGVGDNYEGSEPLDQALADRFAFILEVPDWPELDEESRKAIANPAGEGVLSEDGGEIHRRVASWKAEYSRSLLSAPEPVIEYAKAVATVLGQGGLRISPRRVRQLVRNILAMQIVTGESYLEKYFLLALRWSLPHRAWGVAPKEEVILAAHRTAWATSCAKSKEKWLFEFHLSLSLPGKIERLVKDCPDPDLGSLAVAQFLSQDTPERAAAFSFALYPLALKGDLKIGREGVADLARLAREILDVRGEIQWQERLSEKGTTHPEYSRLSRVLSSLPGTRRERATQLFYHLLSRNITLANPEAYEKEFDQCIGILRQISKTK